MIPALIKKKNEAIQGRGHGVAVLQDQTEGLITFGALEHRFRPFGMLMLPGIELLYSFKLLGPHADDGSDVVLADCNCHGRLRFSLGVAPLERPYFDSTRHVDVK